MENEDNKRLVAEFMGFEVTDLLKNGRLYICKDNKSLGKLVDYINDWNSLMLVVEKIEILGFEVRFFDKNVVSISGHIDHDYDRDFCTGDKKQSTYTAVVQFIEWYNKQKPTAKEQK